GPAFHLKIGRPDGPDGMHPVVLGLELPDASIHSVTADDAVESDVHGTVSTEMKGSLFTTAKAPVRPIVDSVFQVGSRLSSQISHIIDFLNTEHAPQPLSSVEWDLHLTETLPSKPLFRVQNDTLEFRLGSASFGATWNGSSDSQNPSRLSGSGAVDL